MSTQSSFIRTDTKAEQLAQFLAKAIDAGEIAAGELLGTKQELMRRHDLAAGTLNEALRLLSSRGYIELRSGPKGGAFATRRSTQVRLRHTLIEAIGDAREMDDVVKIRDELEVLVAVEAARACRAEDATRILAAEQAAVDAEPGTERLLRIWDLHREIAQTGSNTILAALYANLLDTLANNIASVTTSGTVPRGVSADTDEVHRNLVAAIVGNDIEGAVRAARAHTPIGPEHYLPEGEGSAVR